MNRAAIQKWLPLVGTKEGGQHREGWVVAHCPLALSRHDKGQDTHPSFGVKIEAGESFCHCFSCGFSGKQSELVLEMQAIRKIDGPDVLPDVNLGSALQQVYAAEEGAGLSLNLDTEDKAEPEPWPEWWLDSFTSVASSSEANAYLLDRGVIDPLDEYLDLRWDAYRKRIGFPIRDWSGHLFGMTGRSVDGSNPKYHQYIYAGRTCGSTWLNEDRVDVTKPLVLVEGPFDLAAVLRVYRNVVASMGTTLNRRRVERLRWCGLVITLFDYGKAGNQARTKVSQYRKKGVRHVLLPAEIGDPGAASSTILMDLLGDHVDTEYRWWRDPSML